MFDKLKRKSKQKRKRGESILPYVAIFGLVVVVIVGAAGAYFLTRPPQEACLEPGPECIFATPTMVPYSLYPTDTPAITPERIGQSSPNNQAPMISSLALSPDEQVLLMGLQYAQPMPHIGEIAFVELEQDAQSEDGLISLDRVSAKYELAVTTDMALPQLSSVDDIDISPDGSAFIIGSRLNQVLERYSVDERIDAAIPNAVGDPITFDHYSDAAFSPDGRYFAIAGYYGVSLYDAASLDLLAGPGTEIELSQPRMPRVVGLAFNHDGSHLIVARSEAMTDNMGPYLENWQVEDGTLTALPPISLSRQIMDIDLHPTANQVAVAMPGQIGIYDLDTEQHESYAIDVTPAITTLTYHPEGYLITFGGSHDAVSGSFYAVPIGDDGFPILSTGQINVNTMGFTSGPVTELVYAASGQTIFVGVANGGLYAWDTYILRSFDHYSFE